MKIAPFDSLVWGSLRLAPIITTTCHYRGHSAIVQPNTDFATVHSQVTEGGCSVEYEYKLLHQFAWAVAHRMPYTSILSICATSLQGHTKCFWKKNFPVHRSCFRSHWVPVFQVSSSLSAIAALFYSEIWAKRFVWPCSELLWLCLSHK